MTTEQREILDKINAYAEEVLADIDPQKTPVSYQLEKLRPVMDEIAASTDQSVEDVFILYMDLASEAGVEAETKFQNELNEDGLDFSARADRLE